MSQIRVILCHTCVGFGYVEKSELTNYHRGEYDTWDETCATCKGKGRLFQETIPEKVKVTEFHEHVLRRKK